MSYMDSMVGFRRGTLVIINPSGRDDKYALLMRCQCDCGEIKTIRLIDILDKRLGKCNQCNFRARQTYNSMHNRCYNKNCPSFNDYGGRGIKVCKRWFKFKKFFIDMGYPPYGMSLDRIDVNGNYEPENCRWATKAQQARNRRNAILITMNNETRCLIEWCEQLNLDYNLVQARLRMGWCVERSFNLET